MFVTHLPQGLALWAHTWEWAAQFNCGAPLSLGLGLGSVLAVWRSVWLGCGLSVGGVCSVKTADHTQQPCAAGKQGERRREAGPDG